MDEDINCCCPTCGIDLGSAPTEKLRSFLSSFIILVLLCIPVQPGGWTKFVNCCVLLYLYTFIFCVKVLVYK
uniref:Uncharacterized protein n=1 Tax=Arundo donax TaxID=35708 RepID=A0A0A9E1J1_ARUDO